MSVRTYSELISLPTFEERFRYLKLGGKIGEATFGFQRWLNQEFYHSSEWLSFRDDVIIRDITYHGDSEIGVMIYIHAIGPATNINIYNTETREVTRINTEKISSLTGKGIVASDDIVINTAKGEKSITLIREGVSYNILNCLDKNTDWFTLAKGDNIFAFTADSGVTNLQFRVENKVIYEGV